MRLQQLHKVFKVTGGKYSLDLEKIPIPSTTLSQTVKMWGFHERFS